MSTCETDNLAWRSSDTVTFSPAIASSFRDGRSRIDSPSLLSGLRMWCGRCHITVKSWRISRSWVWPL